MNAPLGGLAVDPASGTYLRSVLDVLEDGDFALHGVYVAGSVVFGDYDRRRSDLDLLAVVDDPLSTAAKTVLVTRLSHLALPCPAHGLDLGVYTTGVAREPSRVPHADFGLSTGAEWDLDVSLGEDYGAGLIDLAVCRGRGRAVHGVDPAQTFGPVADEWLREELRATVEWHRERVHDPFHDPTGCNAVLNACRAWRFFDDGTFVSKTDGGMWVTDRVDAPIVRAALDARRQAHRHLLPVDEIDAFLTMALAALDGRPSAPTA